MATIQSVSTGAVDLKRTKRKRAPATALDRLPPHSTDMEQGVLGCILISPDDCMAECVARLGQRSDAFYDVRHQKIYDALLTMWRARDAIEVITVQQRLKDDGELTDAGGNAYISSLPDAIPSAANLAYYLDIVCEKFEQRKIVQTCTEMVSRVYDFTGPHEQLMDEVRHSFTQCFDSRLNLCETITFDDATAFDATNDPNNIIGMKDGKTTRFLCRGHSAWLIGPSGIGKSSLLMFIAVSCCLGMPFFGVTPQRPLRVMIVQAENDMGDLSEMLKGLRDGFGMDFFDDSTDLLRENFVVKTSSGMIGEAFCQWMEREIINFRADIVFVDPLLSFAGIEVGRQDQASKLCRMWIDPILKRTGAVMISNHHTGKPEKKNGKPQGPQSIYELMYSGIGSSELVNWARAVMILQPTADGENAFRLTFAKRGKRAWARHPGEQNDFTLTVWLQHAQQGIFWQQIAPPAEADDAPKEKKLTKPEMIATCNLGTFLSQCPKDGESLRSVIRRLTEWLSSKDCPKRSLAQCSHGSLFTAVGLMLENEKLLLSNNLYFKGSKS